MIIRMSKPLTRTEDDVDRENLLKDQVSHLKGQSYVMIITMSKTLTPGVEPVVSTPFFYKYSTNQSISMCARTAVVRGNFT
jgi:hypothetical protein